MFLDRYSRLCIPSTAFGFLLDATLQLQSTGIYADLTGSHFGIESRSPFVNLYNLRRISQSINTFRNTQTCKSVLRRLFLSRYDKSLYA